MSSAYFFEKIGPDGITPEVQIFEVYELAEALTAFLKACAEEEWAELRWSS